MKRLIALTLLISVFFALASCGASRNDGRGVANGDSPSGTIERIIEQLLPPLGDNDVGDNDGDGQGALNDAMLSVPHEELLVGRWVLVDSNYPYEWIGSLVLFSDGRLVTGYANQNIRAFIHGGDIFTYWGPRDLASIDTERIGREFWEGGDYLDSHASYLSWLSDFRVVGDVLHFPNTNEAFYRVDSFISGGRGGFALAGRWDGSDTNIDWTAGTSIVFFSDGEVIFKEIDEESWAIDSVRERIIYIFWEDEVMEFEFEVDGDRLTLTHGINNADYPISSIRRVFQRGLP